MRLYVNIDHVATVRQARRTDEPDPVRAAVLVEQAGAHGITVHLREDRRHIQDRDLRLLAQTVRTCLNLEVSAEPSMVAIAGELAPLQVTLVPERREEVTTEGGLNLSSGNEDRLRDAVESLTRKGVRVSLFIDPDRGSLDQSQALGAQAVELHTGEYANARGDDRVVQWERLRVAASHGVELGLSVHAGHGLTYENVTPVAAIPEIEEVNIGHSIISRALFVGLERAVAEMLELVQTAPSRMGEPPRWRAPLGF